ncbi:ATP-binding SpoIIE family protein phosphatase [Streptomyces fructofermentans]|uniref:ATP-binding SpoIIE family protein phosphatase n=1 Tax=Streptomyces fructofermentans TaxID=152141 RepID=UPI0037875378
MPAGSYQQRQGISPPPAADNHPCGTALPGTDPGRGHAVGITRLLCHLVENAWAGPAAGACRCRPACHHRVGHRAAPAGRQARAASPPTGPVASALPRHPARRVRASRLRPPRPGRLHRWCRAARSGRPGGCVLWADRDGPTGRSRDVGEPCWAVQCSLPHSHSRVRQLEDAALELPEGSLLALCTDGLVETRDGDIEEGMHRLGAALAQRGLPLEELCTRAMQPIQGRPASDDARLLLVRTRVLAHTGLASWTLSRDEAAVRRARLAASQMAIWGLEGLEDSVKLIVSELVTNAVRHSTRPIELRLIRSQVLTVEVSDTDSCSPRTRSAGTTDENGRGLFLVSQLSRRWGTRPTPGGKVVWAEKDFDLCN